MVASLPGSTLACALFVLAVGLGAGHEGSLALAVWLLSFWHYYLYWLAFAFSAAPFEVFKRDAVAMKAVSVAALATVYLAAPLDIVSLAVIAAGILLNARAAAVLGVDRTYYGHEVAGLPSEKLTAFPYSHVAHPMILGNVAAFGGTLLNADFARAWWPLAAVHVALNIGLLAMECRGRGRAVRWAGGIVFAGVLLVVAGAIPITPVSVLLLAAALACAWTLHRCYAPELPGRAS